MCQSVIKRIIYLISSCPQNSSKVLRLSNMSSATFDFELITPEGVLLQEKIQELVANTEAGEVGILVDHADLKSKLLPTAIKFKTADGQIETAAVIGGILEVEKNKVSILTDFAELGKDIDETEADNAAKEAEAKLQTLSPDAKTTDSNLVIAEARLQRELIRFKAAKLRRNFN